MGRDEHRINILAEWLLEVMRRKGLSAAGWARSAGCADTTISRFLKQRRHALRHETIQALARAAEVEPPELDLTLRSIPLVDASSRLQALTARRQELLRELRHIDQMIAAQATDFIEAHRRQSLALRLLAAGAPAPDVSVRSLASQSTYRAAPPDSEDAAGPAAAPQAVRAEGSRVPLRPALAGSEARAASARQPIRRSRDRLE